MNGFYEIATQWICGGKIELIYTGFKKDLGLKWDATL